MIACDVIGEAFSLNSVCSALRLSGAALSLALLWSLRMWDESDTSEFRLEHAGSFPRLSKFARKELPSGLMLDIRSFLLSWAVVRFGVSPACIANVSGGL